MGGPAVIWIGTLVLFAYSVSGPAGLAAVLRPTSCACSRSGRGWRTFPDWVKQLGELGKEVQQDEASHVRHTMDALYYTGIGRQKVSSPIIDHLYVYPDDKSAVEFYAGARSEVRHRGNLF
jgi:hypothetical protein